MFSCLMACLPRLTSLVTDQNWIKRIDYYFCSCISELSMKITWKGPSAVYRACMETVAAQSSANHSQPQIAPRCMLMRRLDIGFHYLNMSMWQKKKALSPSSQSENSVKRASEIHTKMSPWKGFSSVCAISYQWPQPASHTVICDSWQ